MNLERVIAVRNLKTVYRDGDRCVKVFDQDYSKADILNEARNTAYVEESGLQIPRLLAVTMIEDRWAIVTEYIKGKTLSQLMKEEPEKKEDHIRQLIEIQMDFHKHTHEKLTELVDKMNDKIEQASLSNADRYSLQGRIASLPKGRSLCHGDLCPSNIIITEDGTPYVIDWAHVTKGSPAADAARTYLVFCLNDDPEAAELYLDLYCEMSGEEKRLVQHWIPVMAASQSVKKIADQREVLGRFVELGE